MDILEQAEQAARDGSEKIKQELLSNVNLVILEINRLIAGDPELDDDDADFEAAAAHYAYQNGCDKESALIGTVCSGLFLMFEDCKQWDYYRLVTPAWVKDWYEKANAWDLSPDGTLRVSAE